MNQTDHNLKEKTKKVIGLVKNELRGKLLTEFKMHSYLKDDRSFWAVKRKQQLKEVKRKQPPRSYSSLEEVEPNP